MMVLTTCSTPRESDPLYPTDVTISLRVPHVELRQRQSQRFHGRSKIRYVIAAGLAVLATVALGIAYFAPHERVLTTQSLSSVHGNPPAGGLIDGRAELRDSLMKAFGLDPSVSGGAGEKLQEAQQDLKDLQESNLPADADGGAVKPQQPRPKALTPAEVAP